MTDQARAWVRTYGTREGSLVAFSRLKPYLTETVPAYLDQGGQRFDQSVVAEVIGNVARYWSNAGWGCFFIRGMKKKWARWGKGAHPRGPEQEHLKKRSYKPVHDLVLAAGAWLEKRGEKQTQARLLDLVSKKLGRPIGRAAVRGWDHIESRHMTVALAALPATVEALARALRSFLPTGRVYVLDLAELAATVWKPSTSESTQRGHRKRIVDMLMRIGAGRVGVSVAVVGGRVVIGRQRAIPSDFETVAAATTPRSLQLMQVDRSGRPQAEQDLVAARQMIGYVEDFDEQVRAEAGDLVDHYVDVEGMTEEAAVSKIVVDSPMVALESSRGDSSIAMAMGVLPLTTFKTLARRVRREHRIEDHARHEAEHQAAFAALRTRHAEGACFGDLFRWAHRRGGQPMAPFAREIAQALTGIRDFDAAMAALPALGQAGRPRTHAVATVETNTRAGGRIAKPILAAPARIGSVPLIPLKKIEHTDKSQESGYIPTAEEQRRIDNGIPWFLAVM